MRRAKLFKNGSSQAVRLPQECRFEGTEVYVRRIGRAVVLLPIDGAWDGLRQSLDLFTSDFLEHRVQLEPGTRGAID